MHIFPKRLKQARVDAGLSQERLGVLAGIEPLSASARMNQYERDKHEPDFATVERIAAVLKVPEAYFYAKDDATAWLMVAFHRMSPAARDAVVLVARRFDQADMAALVALPPSTTADTQLLTVKQFALAHPAFTDSSLRNLIFHAATRDSSKGKIPGNGLIESGAVIRVGRKILIDEHAFFAWVRRDASAAGR